MKKDYKIEIKPTFWEVTLQSGCYSDWNIDNLFFHANTEEEVWNFLCRYAKEEMKKDYKCGFVWGKNKFQFKKTDWEEDEIDWDTDYGDAYQVNIKRIKIIEFNK